MRLEDYQYPGQSRFSLPAIIVAVIVTVALLLVPANTSLLNRNLYKYAKSLYTALVEFPQELIETHLIKNLNLNFTYRGTGSQQNIQKNRHQGWLIKTWLFWGAFFVVLFPLTLLFLIGLARKTQAVFSRSRFLESYEGTLLWEIKDKVRHVCWRVNFFNWEKGFVLILAGGVIIFLGQFGIQFFLDISHKMMRSLLISFLIYTVGLYVFYLYYNRFSEKRIIGIIDSRMGLKERLVTTLERQENPTPLYTVVLEDATMQLRGRDVKALAPHRFPQPSKKGLGGMFFLIFLLATLISVATPHAAFIMRSYREKIEQFSSNRKTDYESNLESIIREEGVKLKELVDELESDSQEVNFALKESRRLAMQMASLDIEKQDFFLDRTKLPKSESSPETSPEEEKKNLPLQQKEQFAPNIQVSKTPLSLKSKPAQRQDNQDFSQVSEKLARLAMEMMVKGQIRPYRKNDSQYRKSLSMKKNFLNRSQRKEKINDNTVSNDLDEKDDEKDDIDDFIDDSSYWEEDGAFMDQKSSDKNTFSAKAPSQPEKAKNRLQDDKIEEEELKSLLEEIFGSNGQKPVAGEDMGKQEGRSGEKKEAGEKKRNEVSAASLERDTKQPQKQDDDNTQDKGIDSQEGSANDLLNQMPLLSSLDDSRKGQDQRANPLSDSTQTKKLAKNKKGESAGNQPRDQRRVRDFQKPVQKEKNIVTINNPGNVEIDENTAGELSERMSNRYMEEWLGNTEDDGSDFNNAPVNDNGERIKVPGMRIDVLSKNLVVVKNPTNIANPRPEMRDAIVSVETPNLIRGLPKRLSHFVKDVMAPEGVEVFTSELNKLGKDLDNWERANAPRNVRTRTGMSQQKAMDTNGSWTDDEAEIGGSNPKSDKDAVVVRGSKTGRRRKGGNKKFRIDKYPKHPYPHPDMTNISQDLTNLGREMVDLEISQRKALLGRLETTGDSPNTNKEIDREKLKETINRLGKRFEGLGSKIQQVSDTKKLRALSNKMIDQSQELGNMLLGRLGSSSIRAKTMVQSNLRKNKEQLEQLAERLRDQKLPMNSDNFSQQLARMATRTKELADSKKLMMDDTLRKALRQRADSIEQFTEDLRQRNPKGKREMAMRLSKLAREMENLGLGLEQGKSTGKQGGTDIVQKALQQKGKQVELLSEDLKRKKKPMGIKNMASKISQATEEIATLKRGLGSYAGNQQPSEELMRKMTKIKDINRKIQQNADPRRMKDMASQMVGMGKKNSSYSKVRNAPTPEMINEVTRQRAAEMGRQFLQLGSRMRQESNPGQLRKMAKEMTDLSRGMRESTSSSPQTTTGANSQRALELEGQLQQLGRRMREDTKPKELRRLAGQMVDTSRRIQNSGNLPGSPQQPDNPDRQRFANLDRKLSQLNRQMLKETDPQQLRKLAGQITDTSRNLRDLKNQSGKGKPADNPNRQRFADLDNKLSKLNRQMLKETDPQQLRKLAGQITDTSRNLRDLKNRSGNGKPADNPDRQRFADLDRKLSKLNRQMLKETDPKQLRKLAEQITDTSRNLRDLKNRSGKGKPADNPNRQRFADLDNKLSKLNRQMLKETDPQQLRKLAEQITDTSRNLRDLKNRSGNGKSADNPDRQRFTDLDNKLSQLNRQMLKETDPRQLRKLAGQVTDTSRKLSDPDNPRNLFPGNDKIMEQMKQAGIKLQEMARRSNDKNLDMDKLIRDVDRTSQQVKQLRDRSGNLQQRDVSRITKVSQRLDKIRKKMNEIKNIDSRQGSTPQKIKGSTKRPKSQIKDMEKRIRRNPENMNQVARQLQQLSKKMKISVAKGEYGANKADLNRLNQTASRMSNLAEEMQKTAQKRNFKLSDVVDVTQRTMQDTIKKMERNVNRDVSSIDTTQAGRQGKEMSALSREMENLSRMQTRLQTNRKINSEQQKKIEMRQGQLRKLSKRLQREVNPERIQKISRKALQVSKELTSQVKRKELSRQSSPARSKAGDAARLGGRLKKMANRLQESGETDVARKVSAGLEDMIREVNRKKQRPFGQALRDGVPSASDALGKEERKLQALKKELDKRIRQVASKRQRNNGLSPSNSGKLKEARLSSEIKKLAKEIQREKNSQKLDRLSSRLSDASNRMGDYLQGNLNRANAGSKKNNNKDFMRELDKTGGNARQLSQEIKNRQNMEKIKNKAGDLEKQVKKAGALMKRNRRLGSLNPENRQKVKEEFKRLQKLSQEIQTKRKFEDIKKYSTKLDKVSERIADLGLSINAFGRRRFQEDVQEITRDVGNSLQEITRRLDENFDPGRISAELTSLSQELSNLDLEGKKKTDADENVIETDKKIIKESGKKLKQIADKARSLKNPKDIRQMATDLTKLVGNLQNLDLSKSEGEGKNSVSTFPGQKQNFRSRKFKQLAKRIKSSTNSKKTKQIASQMSKLASNSGSRDTQQRYKSNRKDQNKDQLNSGSFFKKIMDLARLFRKDKDRKNQKHKLTKDRDKKDMTRTVAINKIDKLVKKLKRRKKKLQGVYNSKRVLKKSGVSSKGMGVIQKGVMGKMTQSNFSKAKFTDSNVSKDVNVIPDSDIINNTYPMEQNLTDREVFERIMKRLEKNRQRILDEGKDPYQVMPVEKLPLEKDYRSRARIPGKQPIEGDDSHMLAGLGVPDKVVVPGDLPLQERRQKIENQSFMDHKNNSQFLKMPIKMKKEDTKSLPLDRLRRRSLQKFYRLNNTRKKDDPMVGQEIPVEYREILKEMYKRESKSPQAELASAPFRK